ncbi:DNA-binding transcriptional activator of the SARP family [Micromonospora viridifaciens]|uniref:DNA-binding transcriptional activator of the SARP family n=1 Tax=Micromonospora viridifaciens TaxID=1881 RepID=A0A1C4YP14_MICVI|nr:BTAD domain-containing putative transcriptional regulator [Micromonospora viridifaciens]SCF22434.1 DNA-binding transcriptional activator of the SARP family [Micromonospora viridifaciens]
MEFRLLGTFEAYRDNQPVALSNRRQERCLLAVLLLDPGRLVRTDRLIDLLWNGRPPASARGAVHTYIGRLRAALAPYGVMISSRRDGYLMEADGHQIDVDEFSRLTHQASDATEPAERLPLLDRALALWRGPLLADTAHDELRERLHGPLEELRLTGVELRAEAQLALGQHARVAAELTPLVARHPTREQLVATLMTALYQGGRQAEALTLYQTTRHALVEHLGVDPGTRLREVHRRILRADHRLDRPGRRVYEVRVRGESLPWSVGGHPALDFCNTFAGWAHPAPLPGAEWLRSFRTLAVWAGHVGLVDDVAVTRLIELAGHDAREAAAVLDEARTMRARLYACLTDPNDHHAFDAMAHHAETAATVQVFRRGADGRGRWWPDLRAGLRLPVHAVAWSAAELLADPRRLTIRACPDPACGWLFLDGSGVRRWCSLGTCGRSDAEALCRTA